MADGIDDGGEAEKEKLKEAVEKLFEPLMGKKVKEWEIGKFLGAGAYGACFLVKRRGVFAVMKLPIQSQADFGYEVAVYKKIQDPANFEDRNTNIVRVYDSGSTDLPEMGRKNVEYMVMECADGNPITAILGRNEGKKAPTIDGTMFTLIGKLSLEVLRGLYDLHQAGFLHRDMKPENCGYPEAVKLVKLYDLGMARRFLTPEGKLRDVRAHVGLRGTDEWCGFRAEYGYDQGRVDDLWGWHLTNMEMIFCYSQTPQPWSFLPMDHEYLSEFRLFLKLPLLPVYLAYDQIHQNAYRIRFYLYTLGTTDTPCYMTLAMLTNEMKESGKHRKPKGKLEKAMEKRKNRAQSSRLIEINAELEMLEMYYV